MGVDSWLYQELLLYSRRIMQIEIGLLNLWTAKLDCRPTQSFVYENKT
jgi:hypothetical protein